jgi:DNA-binding MarR family transcriptional regulator
MSEKAARTLARYQEVVRACAVMNFRQVTRVVTAHFDEALRPAGLRATQLNLLVLIEGAFAATVTDLAAILAMDRTTLTRNLKLLRARGLVEADQIALTVKGRKAAAAALPLWEVAQAGIVAGLGERRWNSLLGELAATRAVVRDRVRTNRARSAIGRKANSSTRPKSRTSRSS